MMILIPSRDPMTREVMKKLWRERRNATWI